MIADDGIEVYYVIWLEFKVSNNEAMYDAMLVGLAIVEVLGVKEVDMRAYSHVVVNQIMGEYLVKSKKLKRYLLQVYELCDHFNYFQITYIPRKDNQVWMKQPYHGR